MYAKEDRSLADRIIAANWNPYGGVGFAPSLWISTCPATDTKQETTESLLYKLVGKAKEDGYFVTLETTKEITTVTISRVKGDENV